MLCQPRAHPGFAGLPEAAARGLETGREQPVAGGQFEFRVPFVRNGQPKLEAIGQAMDVERIARDLHANDGWMW